MQISSEDTFASDLRLDELEPHIRRLAATTWQRYERERAQPEGRIARTVALKLKTADFRLLTRSLTTPVPPGSLAEIADIACELRQRVQLPNGTRYRLVGVGLAGFVEGQQIHFQEQLFGET